MKDGVVLLTGASGQIGKAIKKQLEEKYIVVTTDVEGDVEFLADLTQINDIRQLVANVLEKHGVIDVLINNAGIAVFTPMMDRTWYEFDRVMKVNVYGTFFLTQEVLKTMDFGKIINIASIYGMVSPDERIYGESGRNSSEVYGMSKASIIQLTKYLATHTPKDVTCNCVSPGGVFNYQEENFVKAYKERVPNHLMALDEEIARVVKFLCSGDAIYINGENIVVDGGYTIW